MATLPSRGCVSKLNGDGYFNDEFAVVIHQILMNAQVIASYVTRKPRARTQLDLTSVHVTIDTLEMVRHIALASKIHCS